MGKILYIRLDSSPLPEAYDEIIVKDFNLESYFCALLGRRLLEDAGQGGVIPYPGRLVTDFEKADKEAYREIIRQWEGILASLLISQSENDKNFIVSLPDSYISWLDRCDIPCAFQIKKHYTHAKSVSIKRKYLFEIAHDVLKNKLDYFLQKNKGIIDRIVFSIDGIDRDCYAVHLWKHILTREYELWTLKDFKKYYLFHIKPFQNEYEDAQSFSEGLAAVKRNKKWGFINSKSELVIDCEYDEVRPFHENMACVKRFGGWGAIDTYGNVKISIIHGKCQGRFDDGLCAFNTFPHKYNYWEYYDKSEKKLRDVIPLIIETCSFSEGLVVVQRSDGNFYVLDRELNDIAKEYGLKWTTYSEGLIAYTNYTSGYGFLDKRGNTAIQPYYDDVSYFSEGLCFVKKNGKWGVIDKKGNLVIQFIFDDFYYGYHFRENLAAVKQNGKWGFVNRTGETVIPFIYDDFTLGYSFVNGFASVQLDGYWGAINNKGENVVPFVYEWECIFSNNLVAVKKCGKWGYVDIKGDVVIPFIYDTAETFENEMACVSLNGKFGYINKEWLKDL